jgi:hypothetical protein
MMQNDNCNKLWDFGLWAGEKDFFQSPDSFLFTVHLWPSTDLS